MKQQQGPRVRVFVIWERVRFTDFGAPSTFTLKRVSDPRASQYWDKERLVSHLLGENDASPVVWDYVAIYPKGKLWNRSLPEPVYSHVPVIGGIDGARDAFGPLLQTATKQTAP